MKKRLPENQIENPQNAQLGAPCREGASKQAGACEHEQKSMVESVTHHALISDIENIHRLTSGIDTLDVGFYVNWGDKWDELKQRFDEQKADAYGKGEIIIEAEGSRPHIFYPGGKDSNYRYHVKYPEYHGYISIHKSADHRPNVYVSFTSEALHWELSEKELIELVTSDIEAFGGTVSQHKISRCDLYADFRIPCGLSLEFLKGYMVGKANHTKHHMNRNKLESFYAGDDSSPIQLRLYNKSLEIKKKGTVERWLLLWFTDDPENVWRIEYQIRRTVLKQFRINSISDLNSKKADLWEYMTGEWFSLRNLDNQNKSRRTIHPFWEKIQACVQNFGIEQGTKRQYKKKKAKLIRWYIQRIANLLIPCAAILKDHDQESCLMKVNSRILQSVSKEDFKEKARKKSLDLGIAINKEAKQPAGDLYNKLGLGK